MTDVPVSAMAEQPPDGGREGGRERGEGGEGGREGREGGRDKGVVYDIHTQHGTYQSSSLISSGQ